MNGKVEENSLGYTKILQQYASDGNGNGDGFYTTVVNHVS